MYLVIFEKITLNRKNIEIEKSRKFWDHLKSIFFLQTDIPIIQDLVRAFKNTMSKRRYDQN